MRATEARAGTARGRLEKRPTELIVDVAVARAIAGDAESALSLIDILEPSEARTKAWIRVAYSLSSRTAPAVRNR